ncbi:MAG: methionine--tRNA ligase subunit beta, partial [Methylococcales bacterium]
NSDLVGKVVNIASRCSGFVKKRFNNQLSDQCAEPALYQQFIDTNETIAQLYEGREFGKAMREIMALADLANQYIDDKKPWVIAKAENQDQELHEVCSMGINLFRVLVAYLKPVVPVLAQESELFLNIESQLWPTEFEPLTGHTINQFKPLMTRVDPAKIAAVVEASKESMAPVADAVVEKKHEPIAQTIAFDDFAKLDLRVAKIIKAEAVDGADKLLQLTVDIGDETRTILAGIKSAYTPESLTGRLVVVVANLEPRKMRFGLSEGMVIAAGPGGEDIWVLAPDEGAQVGMRIK